MAKTRRRSRKAAPARKKKTPAKGARARRAAARPGKGPRKIELRPIRRQLEQTLTRLDKAEQTEVVKDALVRLTRCLNEIHEICGPDMTIPLR